MASLHAGQHDGGAYDAEELGVLVFIHPQSTPDLAKRRKGNGVLDNVIGNPLDTTIELSHLIFEGTLDRLPGLKICAAHGGGYLGSYAPRSDHGCLVFPARCDSTIKLKKKPTEYLRILYFDSLVFTSEALRHLSAEVGSSRIVLGTDYPYPWQDKGVDHILNTPSLNDAERVAILGTTAARLLGIKDDAKGGKRAACEVKSKKEEGDLAFRLHPSALPFMLRGASCRDESRRGVRGVRAVDRRSVAVPA